MVVGEVLPDFRRHAEGRPDFGFGEIEGLFHDFADAEVPDFALSLGRQEDVLALQVAMHDLVLVDILEAEADLYEPL